MKITDLVHNPYVAPYDLNTINASYASLQQTHNAAIDAAAAIKESINKMDLNENESAWKQGKINEVEYLLSNNTEFGNSAAALNELKLASADILFGADMRGRLKRQQNWKANNAKIDSMAIPENYKQNFKEINGYGTYVDKYDENGNIIEGDSWKPIKNPVNSIDRVKLYASALNYARKQKGGNNNVTFLDANGNETTDISKSVDGIWYSKTGLTYEILDEKTIEEAVKHAIANTPGAEESIRQDYDMGLYEYQKSGGEIKAADMFDENGNMYSYNNYKLASIKDFAGFTAYNHTFHTLDFNSAYQRSALSTSNNSSNSTTSESDVNTALQLAIAGGDQKGYIESNVDSYKLTFDNKNASNKVFLNNIKTNKFKDVSGFIQSMIKSHPNKKITGPVNACYAYFEDHPNDFTSEEKANIIDAARDYVTSNMFIQQMEKGLNKDDKEKLRFGMSLSEGQFNENNSKWDKQIIYYNNEIFNTADKDGNITFTMSEEVANNLARKYNLSSITDLDFINSTYNGNNYTIKINEKNRNFLPEFLSKLDKADDEAKEFWDDIISFGSWIFNGRKYRTYSFDNTETTPYLINGMHYNKYNLIDHIIQTYDDGTKNASKIQQTMKVTGNLEPVVVTKYDSLTDIMLDYYTNIGRIDTTERNRQKQISDERIKGFFTGPNVQTGYLYSYDPDRKIYNKEDKSEDLATLLNAVYLTDKKHVRQFTALNGIKDPKGNAFEAPNGYSFDIYVDKDLAKATNFKEGKTVHILYANNFDEGTGYDYGKSNDNKALNAISNTKRSNLGSPIIENNKYLGNTEIQYINQLGKYRCNFKGHSGEVDESTALDYAKAMFHIRDLNTTFIKMVYDNNGDANKAWEQFTSSEAGNSVVDVINFICNVTNASQALVSNNVINYILYGGN